MPRLRPRRPGRALTALVLAGLLPPPGLGAPSPAAQEIAAAERRVEGAAATPDDYVALASAFMRKSRESGDRGYYGRANAAVERALALVAVTWYYADAPITAWAERIQSDSVQDWIRLTNRLGGGMNPVMIVV